MTTDVDTFLMGGAGRSAQFKKHGDLVEGVIMHAEVRQQTSFDDGSLLYWDDGKPRNQLVVTLQTEDHEDDDDDGIRKVYVKGQMTKAVQKAVLESGQRGLGNGGKLTVQYVSDAESKKKGMPGAKQYVAMYEPPQQSLDGIDDDDPSDLPF